MDFIRNFINAIRHIERLTPLYEAIDTFIREPATKTTTAPHIRDLIDVKHWMLVVVYAILPCLLFGIWNVGVQSFVYTSDRAVIESFYAASMHLGSYLDFTFSHGRWIHILITGSTLVLPILLVSYVVGGMWEILFACVRWHPISEGFFVTGILYALILPVTIPLWMVALGVSFGVIISKEVFGGSGMNVFNPALICRCFLFFAYPAYMSGPVWIAPNQTIIQNNMVAVNKNSPVVDGISSATPLGRYNISQKIKRIHIDTIAYFLFEIETPIASIIEQRFAIWKKNHPIVSDNLSSVVEAFVIDSYANNGLGLPFDLFQDAYNFALLRYGQNNWNGWNYFFGNRVGSIGEVSPFLCLLGALYIVITGIGSWRIIVSMIMGAALTAFAFSYCAHFGIDLGAWNRASLDFPIHYHLLLGGFAFGAAFMATDPVSGPVLSTSMWVYGAIIGSVTIFIRAINPAFPEGVMLAILFGNSLAPMIDHWLLSLQRYWRGRRIKSQFQ